MLAYILEYVIDPNKEYVQDIFIANICYAYEIRHIVASKLYSPCERVRNRVHSVACIDANICQKH